jgi:hypothetical protein
MVRRTSLFLFIVVVVAVFVDVTLASSWLFGSDKGDPIFSSRANSVSVYNAWHKTELENWLDDHNIPYPAAADRQDLVDAVSQNWNKASTAVYETWDDNRLRNWLEQRSINFDANAKKDYLIDRVKSNWYNAKVNAESSWETVKDWIFDSYDVILIVI